MTDEIPTNWEEAERLRYSTPTAEKPWEVWDLLDEIVKKANNPSDSTAGLSRLASILPSTPWGYETKWQLSAFTPFLLAVYTLFPRKKTLGKTLR
jgi:hypothetical protein